MKKVALYARVSTDKQTTENQLNELRAVANRMGYVITQEYVDNGISGAKSRIDRPSLDAMMKDAVRGRFDMVMCWSIDRLGRSLQNLIEILNELQSVKVDLYFLQQAIDTSSPMGKMIYSILGALGSYERELIRERVIAGQQRAKNEGKQIGRPSQINDALKESIKLLRSKGMAIKKIAKTLSIGVGSVYKVLEV
jgi:DNA invertase Pin-like site-specific DNA recombinase